MPAFISLESIQCQQRFISFQSPVLAGAFEAGLVLASGGFNDSGADGFPTGSALFVVHPLMMGGEVADFFIQSLVLGGRKRLETQA